MVRRDGVEVVPGGVTALGQQAFVPPPPNHPHVRGRGPHALRYPVQDLRDAPTAVQLDVPKHEPGREQVVVGVDQTRHNGRAAQILDARAKAGQIPHLIIRTHRDEASVLEGDGARSRVGVVDGVNVGVD